MLHTEITQSASPSKNISNRFFNLLCKKNVKIICKKHQNCHRVNFMTMKTKSTIQNIRAKKILYKMNIN